jgi:hypothetical protein
MLGILRDLAILGAVEVLFVFVLWFPFFIFCCVRDWIYYR